MTSLSGPTLDDLARALAGDRAVARALLAQLVPIVRVRVTRVLWRYRGLSRRRDIAQEADDLAQEVLAYLFEEGGRVLRAWDPERGLGLLDFASLIADRTASSILKSGRRTPWRDDPTAPDELAQAPSHEGSHVDALVSRDIAERVYLALRAELSPLGATLFRRLFVDDADVEVICRDHAMSRNAVYAWRSRLARRMRELAAALEDSVRIATNPRTA